MFGPIVDSVDGTVETAQTIAQADRQLSKAGGDFAQTSDTSNAVHKRNGHYAATLTTTDTNTLGELVLEVLKTGCAPFWRCYDVLPAQVWDARYVHPLIAQALVYGQLQGGASASGTLPATASSSDDYYNGDLFVAYDGTGANQVAYIQDYVGSSRGMVFADTLVTAFDATTKGVVIPARKIATLAEVADAVLDEVVEGSYTLRQLQRLMSSAAFGKLSGAAGTSILIRDLGDTKNRVSATVDASGNRSAVTLDAT